MVTEIMPDLYKIDIPLPKSPLKSLNSYVIKGEPRTLIIDSGFAQEECREALFGSLHQLGINLADADVLLTHSHPDHSGLVPDLMHEGAGAYCSREDAEIINKRLGSPQFFLQYFRKCGFPDTTSIDSMLKQPSFNPASTEIDFQLIEDGDLFSVGNYNLRCIKTPGHTPGHMCLYDEEKRILFSGDHILKDISPNISLWTDESNPLADFLTYLTYIGRLQVDLVLPGHRSLFSDCRKRIAELQQAHYDRAKEVLEILQKAPQISAYEVAARMCWNLRYASFYEFPLTQQMFAAGEALAHLRYLESLGKIERVLVNGIHRFVRVD